MIVTRALAACALVFLAGYGLLLAAAALSLPIDYARAPDDYDVGWWWPVALLAAAAAGVAGAVRALPAPWRTARQGSGRGQALRRFCVAWLAVLPGGLLLYLPGMAQLLYTALVLPGVIVLLLAERAASRPRRATRARAPRRAR